MNRSITEKRRRGIHVAGAGANCQTIPALAAGKSRRIVRIFFTDADATDSSSSEEDDHVPRQEAKRFVHELAIGSSLSARRKPYQRLTLPPADSPPVGEKKKFRGVRQRPWGRFSAEIRNPFCGKRIWLGTFDTAEEAAAVYDLAALQIKGNKAITNFPMGKIKPESESSEAPPTPEAVAAAVAEPAAPLPSPTSVLQFDEDELPFGEWLGYGDVDAFGFSVVEAPLCLPESFIPKPAIWEKIEFEELDASLF